MRLPFHCPLMEGEHLLSWFMRYHILSGRQKIKTSLASIDAVQGRLKSYDFNGAFLAISKFYKSYFDDGFCVTKNSPLALWSLSHGSDFFESWKKDNHLRLTPVFEPNKLAMPVAWSYCSACAKEDREKYGFSYWHTEHQIPGSILCGKHQGTLITHRQKLTDLGQATLPHTYSFPNESSYSDWMSDWNNFILKVFKMLSDDPMLADKLKSQVPKILGLPVIKGQTGNKVFIEHQLKLDAEVPTELLEYLFKFYTQTFKRPPMILRSTLGFKVYDKGKHPIYWLVILYWLKDEIDWVNL